MSHLIIGITTNIFNVGCRCPAPSASPCCESIWLCRPCRPFSIFPHWTHTKVLVGVSSTSSAGVSVVGVSSTVGYISNIPLKKSNVTKSSLQMYANMLHQWLLHQSTGIPNNLSLSSPFFFPTCLSRSVPFIFTQVWHPVLDHVGLQGCPFIWDYGMSEKKVDPHTDMQWVNTQKACWRACGTEGKVGK